MWLRKRGPSEEGRLDIASIPEIQDTAPFPRRADLCDAIEQEDRTGPINSVVQGNQKNLTLIHSSRFHETLFSSARS